MTYLVTARHIADRLEPDFDIRFNTKDGRADYVEVHGARWFAHPDDKSVDAAVLPWAPPDSMDCLWVPHALFMNNERMEAKGVGVGDEVYSTGLFSPVIGLSRNTPIVRSGHLAMSPPEEIPLHGWVTPTMMAYLIEMRSLGGLSGSPVFVQRSIRVQKAEHSGREPLAAGAIFLLGLMHGHWNVRHLDVDYVSPPTNNKKEDLLNVGIAIVPPAEKISDILEQDALMEVMSEAEYEAERQHPNYLDGGSPITVRPGAERPLRAAVSAASTLSESSATNTKGDLWPEEGKGPSTKGG